MDSSDKEKLKRRLQVDRQWLAARTVTDDFGPELDFKWLQNVTARGLVGGFKEVKGEKLGTRAYSFCHVVQLYCAYLLATELDVAPATAMRLGAFCVERFRKVHLRKIKLQFKHAGDLDPLQPADDVMLWWITYDGTPRHRFVSRDDLAEEINKGSRPAGDIRFGAAVFEADYVIWRLWGDYLEVRESDNELALKRRSRPRR